MSVINQSICFGCFHRGGVSPAEVIREASRIGYKSVEMLPQEHWNKVHDHGMNIAIVVGHESLPDGLNKRENHDRIEQEIKYFSAEDVPLSLGIVFDVSGSMKEKLSIARDAAVAFLKTGSPEDEYFLAEFSAKPSIAQAFTTDISRLQNNLIFTEAKGMTALYDAVYLAIDKAQNGSEPKKVIVIFTDGEDRDSYYTHEELLEKIRQSDVQVFMIAILDPDLSDEGGFFGVFKSKRHKVKKKIEEIAENTGGKVYFPKKIQELEDVFQQIALELRNQYRLAYITHNPLKNGSWRTITVEVRDAKQKKLSVRAKKGYFPAGPESPAEDDATQN